MRRRNMDSVITFLLPAKERGVIESIAHEEKASIGQIVRDLLAIGLKARKCEP
jgi:hypothetical protein